MAHFWDFESKNILVGRNLKMVRLKKLKKLLSCYQLRLGL